MKQTITCKLAVFDLDGTLADIGMGITEINRIRLRQLEDTGIRIAICSGKTTDYLCGFARQIGLKNPVLVGENGAVIQFGVDLPPKKYYTLPYSQAAKDSLAFLRREIGEKLPHLWYQPNLVGLTPFPVTDADFDAIQEIVDTNQGRIQDIIVYRHVDSYDFTPVGIDKYTGLKALGELLGIQPEETVAVGNGTNDYPMFAYAGFSIGVSLPDRTRASIHFDTIDEALIALLGRAGE